MDMTFGFSRQNQNVYGPDYQAGNFGLVVFDVAEAPADAVRRLPFTTWLRLQRMVEGSHTACVLVGSEAMARSAGPGSRSTRAPQARGRAQRGERHAKLTAGAAPRGRPICAAAQASPAAVR